MPSFFYNEAKFRIFDRNHLVQSIDLENVALAYKWALLLSSYVPNKDQVSADNISAHEIELTAAGSFSGYVKGYGLTGRKALGTPRQWAVDNTNDRAAFQCPSPVWPSLITGTKVKYGVLLLEQGGTDTTSLLIACIESTSPDPDGQPTNGANFSIDIPAGGLWLI